MKGKNITVFVIIGILLILLAWGCGGYNGLVKQDENVKKTWNNVETEYQNRADLVDNLVATVKGAADFEKSTLTDVVEARAKATGVNINAENLTPEKIAEFQQAQGQLSGALSRLLVTIEAYPTLRATENFSKLQQQLESIENGIRNSRRTFNEAVNSYNVKLRSFPMNFFGSMFGFSKKEGFKAEEGAEKAPKVDFK
jgi:LemA protein